MNFWFIKEVAKIVQTVLLHPSSHGPNINILPNLGRITRMRKLTLVLYHPLNYLFKIHVISLRFFPISRSYLGSQAAFSSYFSLATSVSVTVPLIFLVFHDGHFWKILINYFVNYTPVWTCNMFSHNRSEIMHFWQIHHKIFICSS